MVRTFVKDPATGKPAVEVINHEVVELQSLRDAKEQAEAEFNAATVLKQGGYDNMESVASEAESRFNDAKSELEAGESVAGEPDPQPGAEAAGGENPDGDPQPAEF